METFQFTIGYCYPIGAEKNWRERHSFKFPKTLKIKSIEKNEYGRYKVSLIGEWPYESYKVSDAPSFGNRPVPEEFMCKYATIYTTALGTEFIFDDVQSPEFGCKI